jgi:hypothetical protein
MDVTTLPMKDWEHALEHASQCLKEGRRYPGSTGKLIQRIAMGFPGGPEFVVTFSDGTQMLFAPGKDSDE